MQEERGLVFELRLKCECNVENPEEYRILFCMHSSSSYSINTFCFPSKFASFAHDGMSMTLASVFVLGLGVGAKMSFRKG